MNARVLPYSMFYDGSMECRNFSVADDKGYYTCEWDWIKNKFAAYVKEIELAVREYKDYIIVKDTDGNEYELSWD